MQNEHFLNPQSRIAFCSNLRPPEGYRFDVGVGTTYSLDFTRALTIPLNLALYATDNCNEFASREIPIFEAIDILKNRLFIFVEPGQIKGKEQKYSRICSLLENFVVEIGAKNGGSFHPKFWLLQYVSIDGKQHKKFKLLITSRNLTLDRSWDTVLTLDGNVKTNSQVNNIPIKKFVEFLFKNSKLKKYSKSKFGVSKFCDNLLNTKWDIPNNFNRITFSVNGIEKTVSDNSIKFGECSNLAVVSPFCDKTTLDKLLCLKRKNGERPILIGRPDELKNIETDTLRKYEVKELVSEVFFGDAESENADNNEQKSSVDEEKIAPSQRKFYGLHAKLYFLEQKNNFELTIGSGNATDRGLFNNLNVEIFVTLHGKIKVVGGIKEFIGKKGIGPIIHDYIERIVDSESLEQNKIDMQLNDLKRAICNCKMELICKKNNNNSKKITQWDLTLKIYDELKIDNKEYSLFVWINTMGNKRKINVLSSISQGATIKFQHLELRDITKFITFEIVHLPTKISIIFCTSPPILDLPKNRDTAILSSFISKDYIFFNYLRMALLDYNDIEAVDQAIHKSFKKSDLDQISDDFQILEDMVRAYCIDVEKFVRVHNIVKYMRDQEQEIVPKDFFKLWNKFWKTMNKKD